MPQKLRPPLLGQDDRQPLVWWGRRSGPALPKGKVGPQVTIVTQILPGTHPTSERIVEDVTRWPLVIDKIIEYKGGLVPDFAMCHDGCSKRKRRAHGSTFEPAPDVAAIGAERRAVLRRMAQDGLVKEE